MKSPHRSLLLLLVALSPVSAFAHSAVEPAPRADQGWKDRQELLNKRAAEAGDKAQIIFVGDSITQGWEGEGKEVWAKYYAHRNAVNLGIGGDRTQHVLWRLDHGNLEGLKPRAAVVMIGTNNSNGEDNTVEQIADGVAAIVKQLREKLPQTKVLLLSIFPRSENPSPQRGKVLQVNQIVQKLADDQSVFWIDFGYKFVNSDGTIPHDLMPDYLHLSKRGYEIWAEAIEDKLSTVLDDTRVKAEQSGAGVSPAGLTGEWAWTMDTPNGTVTAPLILKQDGEKVTGKFRRDENRWLEIENGKVNGNEFSWIVKRDRPNGETMTYEMTGKVEGDTITAKARTTLDGNETLKEWTAKRK
ncbi:MAG TPA: platelet-activating factor acetylhydrolase IB subunit [Verrucomicrobiae bacterium]|nr:platelet-activating factor acetylhydrolase IB subunit [Verrucomicrobiae bacterium]